MTAKEIIAILSCVPENTPVYAGDALLTDCTITQTTKNSLTKHICTNIVRDINFQRTL